MPKRMATVGSSTRMRGRARGFSRVQMVSPMVTSSIPATTTMSPGWALSTSASCRPS